MAIGKWMGGCVALSVRAAELQECQVLSHARGCTIVQKSSVSLFSAPDACPNFALLATARESSVLLRIFGQPLPFPVLPVKPSFKEVAGDASLEVFLTGFRPERRRVSLSTPTILSLRQLP